MRVGASDVALALLLVTAPVAAQDVTVDDVKIQLTGRIHVQFNTTNVNDGDLGDPGGTSGVTVPGSLFEVRRARIALELQFLDWITGMIEPDVAMGQLEMKRTFLDFRFSRAFRVRTGQFKKPFSLIELTSSLETPVIERSLMIRHLTAAAAAADEAGGTPLLRRFNGDLVLGEEQSILDRFGYKGYDLGMMVHGDLGAFGYQAGVYNGSGADAPDDTGGKAWAARLTWTAPTATPVRVGGAVSYSERSSGSAGLASGTAYDLDLEVGAFRRSGLHVLAEVVGGSNLAVDESFVAGHTMAAWWIPVQGQRIDGIELVGRASWGDPNRRIDADEGALLSGGMNLYLRAQNRLMLNWDVFTPHSARFGTWHALRAQAQVAF